MYFVRGKFKNIADSLIRSIIKQEVPAIKKNDILYLFEDGYYVHPKTRTHSRTELEATTEEEMRKIAKRVFTQYSIIYKPATSLQKESSSAAMNAPKFIHKHKKLFIYLVNNRMRNITKPVVAKALDISKEHANDFIDAGIKKGVLEKYTSYWRVPKKIWANLRTMLDKHMDFETSDSAVDEETELQHRIARLSDKGHSGLAVAVMNEKMTIEEAENKALKEREADDKLLERQSKKKKKKSHESKSSHVVKAVKGAKVEDRKKLIDPFSKEAQ